MTPKIWLFLSKLFFTCPKEPTSGKMNFFLKNLYISIVRGLWAEIEQKLSEKKIQQSFQKCIMGVRMDIFRLIALLDFIFMLNVYRLSAKVSRAFVRRKSASSQIYNLCVLRKFLKAFFIVFFKNVFSFERNFSRKYNLRIRRNNLIFFWSLPCFEIDKVPTERSQSFGPQTQQVVKIANYVLGRSFNSIFCNDWTFRFSNFQDFERIFLHFGQKKQDVLLNVHTTFPGGGIPMFTFFKRNFFGEFRKKFKENLALVPEKFVALSKQISTFPMEHLYRRKKFSLKRSSFFTISRTFS